jgi:hypothetical protein
MARIDLAPFAPDRASVDASVSAVATNVVPRSDGYGPVLAPVPLSLALPSECRGATAVFSPTYNFPIYVAGTSDGLFVYKTTDKAWHPVTNTARSYSVPPSDYWSFAVYGDLLLACSAGTPVQKVKIDQVQAGKAFEDLGGNPPRARHMGVVGDFLVLAGLPDTPQTVRWSDSGDIEQWGLGLDGHEADEQPLPDGGAVTGFAGGEYGVIFQERAIRRMTLSPDSGNVFDCSVLEENRGAVAPWCIAKVGPRIFFLDRDGFYALVIGGGPSTPIGAERVNRFFAGRVDPERVGMTVAFRDPTGERILFAYRLTGTDAADPSLLGEALLYDWLLDRWSFIETPIRFGLSAATPDVSIDSIEGSIDDPAQPSLDDPIYQGGATLLAVMTTDNRLAVLDGPALEAVVQTPDAMLARPNRSFVRGVRVDTDADDWRAAVGVREALSASTAVRWLPETKPMATRFAPCRASGRYHRARVRIPAGTTWSYVSAVEPDATAEGMR